MYYTLVKNCLTDRYTDLHLTEGCNSNSKETDNICVRFRSIEYKQNTSTYKVNQTSNMVNYRKLLDKRIVQFKRCPSGGFFFLRQHWCKQRLSMFYVCLNESVVFRIF